MTPRVYGTVVAGYRSNQQTSENGGAMRKERHVIMPFLPQPELHG
jgi:hypothetical protein